MAQRRLAASASFCELLNVLLCHLPSAARVRGNAYQASLESRNPLVPVSPRPPSPPSPRGGRGLGRGAQRPFANQKNRRAQNDLGRRPTTPQKRGAVDQGHSAATERTQALDDEPRRPARTRCSAARRSFKGRGGRARRGRLGDRGASDQRWRWSPGLLLLAGRPHVQGHSYCPASHGRGPEAAQTGRRRRSRTTSTPGGT